MVLIPCHRMGMGLPAPDMLLELAGLSVCPEVLLGTQEGKTYWRVVCTLCGNRTDGCQEDFFSPAQIVSGIVLWLTVMAHGSSS